MANFSTEGLAHTLYTHELSRDSINRAIPQLLYITMPNLGEEEILYCHSNQHDLSCSVALLESSEDLLL